MRKFKRDRIYLEVAALARKMGIQTKRRLSKLVDESYRKSLNYREFVSEPSSKPPKERF